MTYLIIFVIRVYWLIIPIHKRRNCLFHESCSNYVYNTTKNKGFYEGIKALKDRFHKCRPGYQLYKNEKNNSFELVLSNGSRIKEEEISTNLLPPLNMNYLMKFENYDN